MSTSEIATTSEREKILGDHRDKIDAAHQGFIGSMRAAGNATLAGANFRREVGIYLESLKTATDSEGRKVVPHGEWEGLFSNRGKSESLFTFTYETARNYIQWAKKHPNPILSLSDIVRDGKDMLVDAGEVEKVMPGFTPQPIPSAFALANKFWQAFNQKFVNGCLKSEDRATWTPEYRDGIKDSLKPIVEFYQSL